MFNAIIESVETGGLNVIDTAINYRYQKSERTLGAALRFLLDNKYSREELFLCSKIGYIPVILINILNIILSILGRC